MRLHRPSPATAIASVALVVALGGVGVAAVPARDGDVHLCYSKRTGAVEVVDTQLDRFRCPQNWRGFTLDSTPNEVVARDRSSRATASDDDQLTVATTRGALRFDRNKVQLQMNDEILLKTGDASILMKKDGTIQIDGKAIRINGETIDVNSTGDTRIKGSKVGGN